MREVESSHLCHLGLVDRFPGPFAHPLYFFFLFFGISAVDFSRVPLIISMSRTYHAEVMLGSFSHPCPHPKRSCRRLLFATCFHCQRSLRRLCVSSGSSSLGSFFGALEDLCMHIVFIAIVAAGTSALFC